MKSGKCFVPLPVSDADREEYDYLLQERAGIYDEQGLSESKAMEQALNDLGCIEFWQYVKQVNEWCEAFNTQAGFISAR